MNPRNAYKHCLRCGNELIDQEEFMLCSTCGHKHFISPVPCNAVIIENDNGEILLVRRKVEPKKDYWDLPGGFIKPYESFAASAKREIKEELQVEIAIEEIIGIYHDVYVYQNVELPTLGICVKASILSGEINPADDINGYQFFSKETVLSQKLAFNSISKGLQDYLK